jgi:transposase, IS30 family
MRLYSQISKDERAVIQKMIYSPIPKKDLSIYLGRNRSTIYRECIRNKTKGYNWREAHECALVRRNRRKRKLDNNGILRLIVLSLLIEKNSPEVISYYLRDTFPDEFGMHISHEAIYQWLYEQYDLQGKLFLTQYLFTHRRRRQNRALLHKKRDINAGKRSIRDRPVEAHEKSEAGHIEGDLIVSAGNDAYMLTLVDRKLMHTWGLPVHSKDPELVSRAVVEALSDLPDGFVKTITFDNGSEFSSYEIIENALSCKVFFADPYCSWQRGLNEHINGRIRQYIPKKMSFAHLTDDDFNDILYSINNRPRKSLDWCCPSRLLEKSICCT